ncbi:MAG: DnaJ domain-containing protein [Methylophilus sp.]|jgi:curved DNA-binding protein CbpA
MKTYYEILGIDKTATKKDIKSAYLREAAKHHPDKGGNAEAFNQAKEAFDVLYHDATRAEYDETGTYTKAVDNSSKVIELLRSLFLTTFEKYVVDDSFDMFKVMKTVINECIRMHQTNISKNIAIIEKFKRLKDRVKRTTEGENYFATTIDKQISALEKDIADRENGILLNELMLEQLENFIMESNALSLNTDVSEIDRYNKAQQSKPPFQWFGNNLQSN